MEIETTRTDEVAQEDVVVRLRAAGCVFAEEEAELLCGQTSDPDELERLVARRVTGEPLELVLGWAEFDGLRIAVDPGVFVPRKRTEFLAIQAAALLGAGDVVIDLCCGAGAIGAALAVRLRDSGGIELHAADVDPRAVACARRNLAALAPGDAVFVYEGDLDEPLPDRIAGRVAVLTANVPYVPSSEIPLLPQEAREYEPQTALDGGVDGLAVLRRVAAAAPRWLRPGGSVLIEISERQEEAAVEAFAAAGLEVEVVESEDYYTTVIVGRTPLRD